jgi:alkylhydroperoxidase family enzyme
MDIGSAVGRAAGVTEEQLLELPRFAESEAFSALERAVIEYATRMTETPVDVPSELSARLARELGTAEIVELTAAIAWENYRARFNHALGVPADGYSDGAVCALPARPSVRALDRAPCSAE